MADGELIFNRKFTAEVLRNSCRRIVEDRTRAIASGAQAAAGRVGGSAPRFFVDFAVVRSGRRYRGAVVVTSRNPERQEAGRAALVARLKASV